MSPKVDPRLKIGAYVRQGTNVYYILRLELDDKDAVTGMFVLEDIRGEYSCGSTYVHRQIVASASTLTKSYELVMAAPVCDVPDYLDSQMSKHLAGTDIAA